MSAPTIAPASASVPVPAVRRSKMATGVLATASLIALGIGAAAFATPIAFSGQYGIEVAGDASALNEARAAGAAVLILGVLTGVGALRSRWAAASAFAGATMYLAYGFARLFSVLVDGMPAPGLIGAAVAELVIGGACLAVWVRLRRKGASAR